MSQQGWCFNNGGVLLLLRTFSIHCAFDDNNTQLCESLIHTGEKLKTKCSTDGRKSTPVSIITSNGTNTFNTSLFPVFFK